MKLHRFYSQQKIDDGVSAMAGASISYTDVSQQWAKVLRLARGEEVVVFDASGYDFRCEIKDYQGETVILKVLEKTENKVKAFRSVVLYAALVKKDTFEWIVQKATELGVSDIVPLLADRSEKKNINIERLQKIIVEAAEQSGRGTLPVLHEVVSVADILSAKDRPEVSIVFEPLAPKISQDEISKMNGGVAAFIGPEGGWSQKELENFEKAGLLVRSLGPQVLRAETAVVAALAKLIF